MKRFQWTLRKSMVRIAFLACLLAIPTLPYQCSQFNPRNIERSNLIHGLADGMVKQGQLCWRLERRSRAAGRFQEADWYRNQAAIFARRERKLRREAWAARYRGDGSFGCSLWMD
jgi:hypothetical protein